MTPKQEKIATEMLKTLKRFRSEIKADAGLAKGADVDRYVEKMTEGVVKAAAAVAGVPFEPNASTAQVLAAMIDSVEPERFKSMPMGVQLQETPRVMKAMAAERVPTDLKG